MSEKKDLHSSLAIVTGAAGGIGFEFAKVLTAYGSSLLLIDINEDRLQSAKRSLKALTVSEAQEIRILALDLTSIEFVRQIDDYCRHYKIEPDILINNAGIFSFAPISNTALRKVETFIDLHVRAVTLLSQWFISKNLPRKRGYLLNMSSMSCWMPMPGLALYSSTKSYIRVFTRALHYEAKDYGIGVTVACPGGIATDLFGLPEKWKKFAVAIRVLDTPQRFAKKAVKKMLARKKQYINGLLNRFSIFFIGILPTRIRMMIKHQLLDKGITR